MATYAELCTRLQDTVENPFTADQLAAFCSLAEQKIYQAVQLPSLRKTAALTFTTGAATVSLPADFLYAHSLGLTNVSGRYQFLVDKDQNYLREAYPNAAATGTPRVYSVQDDTLLMVAPTPDANYTAEFWYGYYPESLVTAGTTWLSTTFDSVLFNAMLVEAARFMKLETDLINLYDKQFMDSIVLLKNWAEGKMRTDTFRSVQPRAPVK